MNTSFETVIATLRLIMEAKDTCEVAVILRGGKCVGIERRDIKEQPNPLEGNNGRLAQEKG